jgi:hypothetical protein
MPLPGLCRMLMWWPPLTGSWSLGMRHSSVACLALLESDNPTLHFLKHD